MKRILFATLAATVMAVPSVTATTMTFSTEGTINFDANGNALTHTEDGVTATVTAWSAANGTDPFAASKLRRWSTGLGICANSTETTSSTCSDPQHAADNDGRKEVFLITFSTPVLLTEALISAWASDFDATFWGGTGTITPMTGQSFSTLDTLALGPSADRGHNEYNHVVSGNASDGQFRTINLSSTFPTPVSWLVFGPPPSETDDTKKDHFKFKSLTFTVPRQDTPEPGVLALLAIGTALLAARSRKRS